jgi:hypothetical protein
MNSWPLRKLKEKRRFSTVPTAPTAAEQIKVESSHHNNRRSFTQNP